MISDQEVAAAPAALPTERLEMQLRSYSAHLAAATCRWLLLIAEYDARKAYESWECTSAAEWLERHCHLARVTAREYVRVASALVELPVTIERFGAGALSYSKVRALVRVATPSTEAELVGLATSMSASQFATTMRVVEQTMRERSDDEDLAALERREARRDVAPDGTVVWTLHMTADDDARFSAAIDHARDVDFEAARDECAEGARVPAGRGGGLDRLDAILLALDVGVARFDEDAPMGDRYLTVINMEAGSAALDAEGNVLLGGSIRLAPAVARRLSCDTTIQLVEERPDGGVRMGRRVRTFTRRQRLLIAQRQRTCAFPTCTLRAMRCQFHHLDHWIDGGLTDVDNGVPLCGRHHRAMHEGRWRMHKNSSGEIVAIGPDGTRLVRAPERDVDLGPRPARALATRHERLGLEIRPHDQCEVATRSELSFAVDGVLSLMRLRELDPPLLN